MKRPMPGVRVAVVQAGSTLFDSPRSQTGSFRISARKGLREDDQRFQARAVAGEETEGSTHGKRLAGHFHFRNILS